MRREQADLVENLHQVPLAARIVVRPHHALRRVAHGRAIAEPDEGEAPVVAGVRHDLLELPEAAALGEHGAGACNDDHAGEKNDREPHFLPSIC